MQSLPDGSDVQQVSTSEVDELQPKWSPDSKYILFVSGRKSEAEIYIGDESGKVLRVTSNQLADTAPAWGPIK